MTNPAPDYAASVDFLLKFRPGGPWVLTSIGVDRKSIATATFTEPEAIRSWLERFGKSDNVYFSVNPTRSPMNKKPSAKDVETMDWLHVDVDPLPGERLTEAQPRILKALQGFDVPPTLIIASGGGYQAFWRLDEPFPIQGDPDKYENAKLYNLGLEKKFEGADSCHNVDRIMRLPGTINRPDEKKRRKGRVEALAEVVNFGPAVYSIKAFDKAPQVQTSSTGFGATRTVEISGNLPRVADVNDVPGINDLCKVAIVQGCDPDDPSRWSSRSEVLHFVCCELVRADASDDLIYAIITDPDFRISESVLDKKSGSESYAVRQIERAREVAVDPALMELNDRYAVTIIGSKTRVIYEEEDPTMGRARVVKMTFEDFQKYHSNRRIEAGVNPQTNQPVMVPLGKWWLSPPATPDVRSYCLCAGQGGPGGL
jgi:hypothetical protein